MFFLDCFGDYDSVFGPTSTVIRPLVCHSNIAFYIRYLIGDLLTNAQARLIFMEIIKNFSANSYCVIPMKTIGESFAVSIISTKRACT